MVEIDLNVDVHELQVMIRNALENGEANRKIAKKITAEEYCSCSCSLLHLWAQFSFLRFIRFFPYLSSVLHAFFLVSLPLLCGLRIIWKTASGTMLTVYGSVFWIQIRIFRISGCLPNAMKKTVSFLENMLQSDFVVF